MSEDQLVWPQAKNMMKCRHHAKVLYGALRARDIPFIEKYLDGDHSDKDVMEVLHILQATNPARDHLANWTAARSTLRSKLVSEGYHEKVINAVLNGLYRESEDDK